MKRALYVFRCCHFVYYDSLFLFEVRMSLIFILRLIRSQFSDVSFENERIRGIAQKQKK